MRTMGATTSFKECDTDGYSRMRENPLFVFSVS